MGGIPIPEKPATGPAEQSAVPIEVTRWTARLVDDACEQDYRVSRLADDRRRFQFILLFLGLTACFNLAGDLYAVHTGIDLLGGWIPYVVLIAAALIFIPVVRHVTTPRSLELVSIAFATIGMGTTLALLVVHPRLGSIWGALMPGMIIIIYFCVPLRLTTMVALAVGYTLVVPLTWGFSAGPAPTSDDMYRSVLRMALANVLGFSVINTLFRSQRIQFAQNCLLQKLLSTDSLTGIANRRHFDCMLAEEWRRCARNGVPLSLLMIDVDYFKEYNDRLGHLRGDDCLRRIALLFTQVGRRGGDLVARYGGEEFVCLLPNTDTAGAVAVAARLQEIIDQARIPHPASPLGPYLSISIGAAAARPAAETPEALVDLADRLLYAAKKKGRKAIAGAELGSAEHAALVQVRDETSGAVGQARVA